MWFVAKHYFNIGACKTIVRYKLFITLKTTLKDRTTKWSSENDARNRGDGYNWNSFTQTFGKLVLVAVIALKMCYVDHGKEKTARKK